MFVNLGVFFPLLNLGIPLVLFQLIVVCGDDRLFK